MITDDRYRYVAKFPVEKGFLTDEIREFAAKLRRENPNMRVCYFYNGPRRKDRFGQTDRNTRKCDANYVRLYLHPKTIDYSYKPLSIEIPDDDVE